MASARLEGEVFLPAEKIGVVGLGLMGRGIATCLLAYGRRVAAYDAQARRRREAATHIGPALEE